MQVTFLFLCDFVLICKFFGASKCCIPTLLTCFLFLLHGISLIGEKAQLTDSFENAK